MQTVSDELGAWSKGEGDKTVGGLLDVFDEKSFALLFIVLMTPSALPLPTGGATHVFEITTIVLALQLVAGRSEVWLPRRFRRTDLAGERREKFIDGVLRFVRRLERFSRPRLRFLFGGRVSNGVFGLLVAVLTAGAFVTPPFSGLDTLPSLGVVVLSLGVLLEDAAFAIAGAVIGLAGILLAIVVGEAAFHFAERLF